MLIATVPTFETPLVVTIAVLSELPARRPDGDVAVSHCAASIRSIGPDSLDDEPTWEDAAWY
jgi:hypothetical protein